MKIIIETLHYLMTKPSVEGITRDKLGPSFPLSTWKREPKGQPINGCREQFLFPIFSVLQNHKSMINQTIEMHYTKQWLKQGDNVYEPEVRRAKTRRSPSFISSNTLQPSQVTWAFRIGSNWTLFCDIIEFLFSFMRTRILQITFRLKGNKICSTAKAFRQLRTSSGLWLFVS